MTSTSVSASESSGLQLRAVARRRAARARGRFPVAVASVVATREELTLVLRDGLELRLGDGSDLPVKLGSRGASCPGSPARAGYLDVSVPERPVAGETLNSQVEVETTTSTSP